VEGENHKRTGARNRTSVRRTVMHFSTPAHACKIFPLHLRTQRHFGYPCNQLNRARRAERAKESLIARLV